MVSAQMYTSGSFPSKARVQDGDRRAKDGWLRKARLGD